MSCAFDDARSSTNVENCSVKVSMNSFTCDKLASVAELSFQNVT